MNYYREVFSDVETVRNVVNVPGLLPCLPYMKPWSTKKADRSLPLWVTNPYQTHMIMFSSLLFRIGLLLE
jgi:hypothetical protein